MKGLEDVAATQKLAILYHCGRYHTNEMKQYVENKSTCRRSVLFKNFYLLIHTKKTSLLVDAVIFVHQCILMLVVLTGDCMHVVTIYR